MECMDDLKVVLSRVWTVSLPSLGRGNSLCMCVTRPSSADSVEVTKAKAFFLTYLILLLKIDHLPPSWPLSSPPFCHTHFHPYPAHPPIQQRVVGTSIERQPPPTTRAWLSANLSEARKQNSEREGKGIERERERENGFLEANKQRSLEIFPPSPVLASRDSTSPVSLPEGAAGLGLRVFGWEIQDRGRIKG